ncbi:hypothetical protein PV05_01665 [Exophiala xenobiotica]|uniref:Zn(2)-C6 fungal-type domain-containing protein n=1 Tax=Exophiala xenobiotica TaxID=348802 RepID=A0A0D2DGZ2_9EURO|nr:uncharacterized protein PV05_01665 [Exophiala xenobiotica]KIW61557.1 hypothetical protein PV05_01665 [Exophiala xenobiotica]
MPAPLRKACHACRKAKRPCRPQLPKCDRCFAKGLECTYDLEPVTNKERGGPDTLPQRQLVREPFPSVVYDSIQAAHADAIKNYTANGFDPHYRFPAVSSPEPFALAFEQLNEIPLATFQLRSTPFVHSQILSSKRQGSTDHQSQALDSQPNSTTGLFRFMENEQRRLLSLDVESLPFSEFLANFHKLMAILVASTLNKVRGQAEVSAFRALRDLFPEWTQHFHAHLPRRLDPDLSAWQAWTLAETTRRTIIFALMVEVILEMIYRGFFYYRPMVESLPFDARTGVWEANTEAEWQAAIAEHGGIECSLISWHEFIESGGPEPRKEYDGMLQRLLLIGYFSKAAVVHDAKA